MQPFLLPVIILRVALASAEEAMSPARAAGRDRDRFDPIILVHAERARLNPRLVKAVIEAESEFHPGAISPKGARGLMQVMPATAAELGLAPGRLHDPDHNIRAGTRYLGLLYREAGRLHGPAAGRPRDAPAWIQARVLAAYHAGPRMLSRADWPAVTRRYVLKVLRLLGIAPGAAELAPPEAPKGPPVPREAPPPDEPPAGWL